MESHQAAKIDYDCLHLQHYISIYESIEDESKRQAYLIRKLEEEYITYKHSLIYALHCKRNSNPMDFDIFKMQYTNKFYAAIQKKQKRMEKEQRAKMLLERKEARALKKQEIADAKEKRKLEREERKKKKEEPKPKLKRTAMTLEELRQRHREAQKRYTTKRKEELLSAMRSAV